MRKILIVTAMLALGGCATPQEQVLKRSPNMVPAQTWHVVNCTTNHLAYPTYTTCN